MLLPGWVAIQTTIGACKFFASGLFVTQRVHVPNNQVSGKYMIIRYLDP